MSMNEQESDEHKHACIFMRDKTIAYGCGKKYCDIFNMLGEGIWVIDKDYCTVFVNSLMAEMLGYEIGEMMGRPVFDFLNEDSARLCKISIEHPRQGITEHLDIEFKGKDGGRIHTKMSATYLFDSRGSYMGGIAAFYDIAEHKNREEQLRTINERLDYLLAMSPAPEFTFDPHTLKAIFVSRNAANVFGYEATKFMGDPEFWICHVHPDDRKHALSTFSPLFEKGKATFEYRFLHRDGTYRWIRDELSLSRDAEGKPIEIVGCSLDITERKQMEEKLRQSRDQIRALASHIEFVREEERKRISREIHDELGQALTALCMDLAFLMQRLSGKDPLLARKVQSLSALVNNTIETVRRIYTDLHPPALDELGLADAVKWLAKEFKKRNKIRCLTSIRLDKIEPDKKVSTAIFRVIQECLTNVARHAKAKEVRVEIRRKGKKISVTVTDDGTGISGDRISATDSFGLMSMRERVNSLNGTFKITGEKGKGTEVKISIPQTSVKQEK